MKELIIKKTKNLIYIIRSLIRNYPTSKELSVLINSILDHENPTVKFMNEYVVRINEFDIWVSNYPYAYGGLYHCFITDLGKLADLNPETEEWNEHYKLFLMRDNLQKRFSNVLPDRKTVRRLHDFVESYRNQQN